MTVKELVARLQKLPQDMEVLAYNGGAFTPTHTDPNPKLVCQHVNQERYARKYVEL